MRVSSRPFGLGDAAFEHLKHERYKRVNALLVLSVVLREVLDHQLFLMPKTQAMKTVVMMRYRIPPLC